MKKNHPVAIAFAVFLVALVAAIAGLAGAPIKPPIHTIEQTIPDARIPH